jgi:hypothetical protein
MCPSVSQHIFIIFPIYIYSLYIYMYYSMCTYIYICIICVYIYMYIHIPNTSLFCPKYIPIVFRCGNSILYNITIYIYPHYCWSRILQKSPLDSETATFGFLPGAQRGVGNYECSGDWAEGGRRTGWDPENGETLLTK